MIGASSSQMEEYTLVQSVSVFSFALARDSASGAARAGALFRGAVALPPPSWPPPSLSFLSLCRGLLSFVRATAVEGRALADSLRPENVLWLQRTLQSEKKFNASFSQAQRTGKSVVVWCALTNVKFMSVASSIHLGRSSSRSQDGSGALKKRVPPAATVPSSRDSLPETGKKYIVN